MSIYDYFEDIYLESGIDAQQDAENRVWEMYNNDEEAFDAFIAENDIDLSLQTIDCAEDDFTLWCWDMEG